MRGLNFDIVPQTLPLSSEFTDGFCFSCCWNTGGHCHQLERALFGFGLRESDPQEVATQLEIRFRHRAILKDNDVWVTKGFSGLA